MDFNLAGRTAVVTSTGTGLAVVRLLAASDARGNTRPHSHGQPRQPPVPEPGQRAQINLFSALLQTRTDYGAWQGASRLRAAEYLLYADGDFAATGDTNDRFRRRRAVAPGDSWCRSRRRIREIWDDENDRARAKRSDQEAATDGRRTG